MNPYYQDKWVKIYHGDCREILPQLDVKVDLILTDPPYGCGKGRWDVQDLSVISLLADVLNTGCAIFMWSSQGDIGIVQAELSKHFNLKNIIAVRARNMVGVPFDKSRLQMQWSPLHYGIKGVARIDRTNKELTLFDSGDVWETVTPQSQWNGENRKIHPCQKPTDICERAIYIQSLRLDLVLDPFLGSGTTCYSAKKLNRYSIGIETEEKYCEIAAKRCSQDVMEFPIPQND